MPLQMDNVIGSGGSYSGWKTAKRSTETEIEPFGYQDINDYLGHSDPDTTLIWHILPGHECINQTMVSSSVDEPFSLNS